jgi:hypothetical protein
MGFINARGSDFYYEEQGKGPPILLIPPAGSTASTWGALVSDLSRAGRVIAYDRGRELAGVGIAAPYPATGRSLAPPADNARAGR